jgi:hypothetical protein
MFRKVFDAIDSSLDEFLKFLIFWWKWRKVGIVELWFLQSFFTMIDDFFALIWGSIYREKLGFEWVN